MLEILPLGMHLQVEQPVWQFGVFCLCRLPWLFVCRVVKRIEVKMGENTKNRAIDSWKTQCRWLNCIQIVLGVKMQKLSVSAHAVMRCPFQSTNREVWKMEGARRRRILVVASRRVRWLRSAFCNGDFAIAIARMHADRDGDT